MDAAEFADRSHLVRKKKTRSGGVETWVWVNPNAGGGGRAGAGHVTRDRITEAHTAVAAAVNAPERLHAGHLEALTGHLDHLTRDQIKSTARQLEPKLGGNKAALADRIVAAVTARQAGERDAPAGKVRRDGTPAAPKVEDVHTVPTASLRTDPTRFQYKVTGIGAGGVGQELKGVETWNPELGGTLLVWRDPADKADYVVNGHHRHELADRAGQPTVNVRYVEAADARIARAKGALANIAEGRGSAVDAAKYVRDTGSTAADLRAAGVSLTGKVAADAMTLKDLADRPFRKLTEGRLDEAQALAVAKHLKEPALREALFQKLADREDDGKDWTTREVETAARKMAAAGKVTESGADLFGSWEDEKSTFDQEVELESHVGRLLSQKAADYAAVANQNRAGRVADAGNVLAVDENQRRRVRADQDAETFTRLANLKGPVSAAIKSCAAELAAAKTKREKDAAKQRAVERVQQALDAELAPAPKPVGADPGGAGRGQP